MAYIDDFIMQRRRKAAWIGLLAMYPTIVLFGLAGHALHAPFDSGMILGSVAACIVFFIVRPIAEHRVRRAESDGISRAGYNVCPSCGYDLSALAADIPCPECGAAESTTDRVQRWRTAIDIEFKPNKKRNARDT